MSEVYYKVERQTGKISTFLNITMRNGMSTGIPYSLIYQTSLFSPSEMMIHLNMMDVGIEGQRLDVIHDHLLQQRLIEIIEHQKLFDSDTGNEVVVKSIYMNKKRED